MLSFVKFKFITKHSSRKMNGRHGRIIPPFVQGDFGRVRTCWVNLDLPVFYFFATTIGW